MQAETDRRVARQQQEAIAQAQRERELELRRTDPVGYVTMVEAREREQADNQDQIKQITGHLSEQLNQYDRNVLDVFVGALPEPNRQQVIAKENGIPGRKMTAQQTLRALRQVYLAEGRASARAELMKDQAFIKEIFARYGGQAPEPAQPPVAVRARRAADPRAYEAEANSAVNAWMRSAARQVRQQTGG